MFHDLDISDFEQVMVDDSELLVALVPTDSLVIAGPLVAKVTL